MQPATHTPPPPERFDEYTVVKPLGRGRSGFVYLALDTLLERHVAIKLIPARDDGLLARFLAEARAAARIQHPNVATLYRVGQLDGRAYLVWELVRGRGLDELVRPVPVDRMLRIAIDVARGLAAAHRRGVLHRDIKPANIMLADSGEAKLVDFGLAALLDTEQSFDTRAGTPYFMAPEAWRGEPLDARSDIYSLGLVLYELLAGEGPFRHFTIKELPSAIQNEPARPLQSAAPTVPPGLAAIVDRCLRHDPAQRYSSADELLAALELVSPARANASVPEGNPYRGLRTYEAEHRALFFGRSRPLQLALERLRAESMLVVIGDSGVGKSSLCAAGIVPSISEGGLDDGRRWLVGRTVPGRTPLRNIANAIAELVGDDSASVLARFERSPEELGRYVRGALRQEHGLLLYLDQMEELVTQSSAEAATVARGIASLADGLPGVRVLATARSDFLSRLVALPGLGDKLQASLLLVGAMTDTEIREAIVGPATLKGGRFEHDELIDELVASTTSAHGSLPLLQFTLSELWERRDRTTNTITTSSLDAVGGVAGALAKHADGVLLSLTPAERLVARSLLLRLVTIDDTRARRTGDELRAISDDAGSVLEALVRGRLLVVGESPEGTTYEIAHEALVRGWDTLARWLVEESELRAARHRLEVAAAEWQRLGRRRDLLWSARQLAELDARVRDGITPVEQAFLAESQRSRAIARWVRRGIAAAVVLAIAGAWIGAEIAQRREIARAIDADLAAADTAWQAAQVALRDRRAARAAAFAAWDRREAAEGERAWKLMQQHTSAADSRLADVSAILERALLRDSSHDEVRTRYADLLVERVLLAEAERRTSERQELARRLALFDRDGSRRARLEVPAEVTFEVTPPAQIVATRYDGREPVDVRASAARLAPGPWIVTARAAGHVETRVPLLVERGERTKVTLRLPRSSDVPDGFVYLPPGEGVFGSSDAEAVRSWFNAVPLHEVTTPGYLIARHETTFAEWAEFLDALPAEEREQRRPRVAGTGFRGSLELSRDATGRWQIALQPTEHMLRAPWGEPVTYPSRAKRATQDWRRMPVSGISFDDALAYTLWLQRTGRVRTARLCTEHEWERAARGTDDRMFPHGNVMQPDDANIDETYGKQAGGFGPDEVGSHPSGASPFGVADLAGNVWEWVVSSVANDQVVARGGSYYFTANTARITNRELPERTYRDLTVGFRVCADFDPP